MHMSYLFQKLYEIYSDGEIYSASSNGTCHIGITICHCYTEGSNKETGKVTSSGSFLYQVIFLFGWDDT